MHVTDPTGTGWEVKRRAFRRPDWSRLRRRGDGLVDGIARESPGAALTGLQQGFIGLILVLAVIATLGVLILLVWPLVLLVGELAVALALLGVRLALGRWIVVAESWQERRLWHVKGGNRAAALVKDVADALASGGELPPGWTPG